MQLPSRHTSVEMQQGVLRSAQLLARAQASGPQKTPALWKLMGAALPVAMLILVATRDRASARASTSGVSFDRTQLVSAGLAGLKVSAQDLVDPSPSPQETALPALQSQPPPSPSPRPWRRRGLPAPLDSPRPPSGSATIPERPACEACDRAKVAADRATETLYEAGYGLDIAVPEETPKTRIALGTRIPAVLASPVTTSPEGAPVTAEVASDVVLGGRVGIPAGSHLEGVAFGTESDDRARILLTAVVVGGRTVPLPAVALDSNSDLGLPGKVVSRGSKRKHGGGLLLRALGGAAGYGLGGSSGLAGAALSQLGGAFSQDLTNITRDWMISDKAVRVPAGTPLVAYVRSESEIP
jgi:hypothetical protein